MMSFPDKYYQLRAPVLLGIGLLAAVTLSSCGGAGGGPFDVNTASTGSVGPASSTAASSVQTGSTTGGATPASSGSAVAGSLPDLGVDANLQGKQVFPSDNPWNQRIDTAPVDPDSETLINSIGGDVHLHPDFGSSPSSGIPYLVVAGNTPSLPVSFDYADQSDPGPYPIPTDAPIEGGSKSTGDRHVIVIDRDNLKLYELFDARASAKNAWHAGSGAVFNLNSNTLRPSGWTSADAAGLPIFPGLVRFDEVQRGVISHAIRFTAVHTRKAYVSPALHYASSSADPALPPMGMRVRLKANFDTSKFPTDVQVILKAMKTYGLILADNGSNWFITGAPDKRWSDNHLNTLKTLTGNDFEVVKMGAVVTK